MKKKYYRLDSGDTPIINPDLNVLMQILESEANDYKEEDKYKADFEPGWEIDLVWLTDEEYENLDEA